VSGPRLVTRDYKRARRTGLGLDFGRWRDFGIGLGLGLCVAGILYVSDHRAAEVSAPDRPTPRRIAAAGPDEAAGVAALRAAAPDGSTAAEGQYDFYKLLPKFEVVIPEKERGTRLPAAAQIDRPGVYFLQAGSYRDALEAERIRAQLGKLGIDATVQRVSVDADVWHRVRLGPIHDLALLNRLRAQLRQSDLDSLVIRVDD
jgi:cell division septation protein DedD